MDSKAKMFGHSIHQQLIVFPLGLLATAVIFDVIHLSTANETMALVAFWMQVAGVVGALVAAPFGTIDWLAIPAGTRAKKIGLLHGLTNVCVLLLFILSVWLRWDDPEHPTLLAQVPVFVAFLLAAIAGWLGGELVSRLGVGIHDGAHLNAPNSLSDRPARENWNESAS